MEGIKRRIRAVLGLAVAMVLLGAGPAFAHDGEVRGTWFHDKNANGVQETGEPGLAGWKLFVDINRDGSRDAGEPTTASNADGDYAFTGLRWWEPNSEPRTWDVRPLPAAQQPRPELAWSAPAVHSIPFTKEKYVFADKDFGAYAKGRIVTKVINKGGTQTDEFSFTSNKLQPFKLAAVRPPSNSIQATVKPDTYTLVQAPRNGYKLVSAACDNGNPVSAIKVGENDKITCTFVNVRKADLGKGRVVVVKTEDRKAKLSRAWNFVLQGGPDNVRINRTVGQKASDDDGENDDDADARRRFTKGGHDDDHRRSNKADFGKVSAGSYTLCEVNIPKGWKSSLGKVRDGKACATLTVKKGKTTAVVVDNKRDHQCRDHGADDDDDDGDCDDDKHDDDDNGCDDGDHDRDDD